MNDIKDALTRVADASATTPLSLDDVRGRARRIRRRRTTGAVVASAAAVAIVVGLGVAIGPSGSQSSKEPPTAKSPSATATPSVAVDANAVGRVYRVRLDVGADQTTGAEPGVPYWFDGQIIDTDGTATPLAERPRSFAKDPRTGDWVVVEGDEANALLLRLTPEGKQVGDPVVTFTGGLAVGPDGEPVTITRDNGRAILTEGDRTLDLGGLDWTQVQGVLPNGDVLFQNADGGVSVAHLDVGEAGAIPGAADAAASTQTGWVAYGGDDGTYRTEDADGNARWSVDWAGVSSFSPDGSLVALAGDPSGRIENSEDFDSEYGTGVLWIRDAETLAPVAAFKAPANGYFWNWTWVGDQLLTNVYSRDTGEWTQVRLSADGFVVGRGTSQKGSGEEPAYVFATQ
jgi:hypothetical protein